MLSFFLMKAPLFRPSGRSLLELLVAIIIIVLLAALTFPLVGLIAYVRGLAVEFRSDLGDVAPGWRVHVAFPVEEPGGSERPERPARCAACRRGTRRSRSRTTAGPRDRADRRAAPR